MHLIACADMSYIQARIEAALPGALVGTRDERELLERSGVKWSHFVEVLKKYPPPDPNYIPPSYPEDPPPPRHESGELFTYTLSDTTKILGRIARNDVNLWERNDDYLLYFYRPECKPTPKCKVPPINQLLIPPVIASDEGWRFGHFKTLRIDPIEPSQILTHHVFATPEDTWVDRTGTPIHPDPSLPASHRGIWGHTFVDMIRDRIVAALGHSVTP
jgi:hypothetical protein